MNIADNVIRHYLRNVYFINGTAYAGKSTMCKMLSERYGMLLCGENYGLDKILSIAEPNLQPNLCYFKQMSNWQEFLSRTPEEYAAWIEGNARESADFEIAELIRISDERRVIVDTNIPCEILKRISVYNRVAIMLSPQSMSVERFFDRPDEEKQFLLTEIKESSDPERTMQNFRDCIACINSWEVYDAWLNSGFYTLIREDSEEDTRNEVVLKLACHFDLC